MYKYINCELTPQVFEELLLQLFANKQFTREECVNIIQAYHLENGGICNHKRYTNTFKHVSQKLRKNGYHMENPIPGTWRLFVDDVGEQLIKTQEVITTMDIGHGSEIVYCYYFPTYKKYSQLCKKDSWPCKIGMTTKNIWDRIYSQSTTCFPEEPFIALMIHCENSKELEQLIHKVLQTRGKWIETSPGQEWYMTNPDEVKSIYLWMVNDN